MPTVEELFVGRTETMGGRESAEIAYVVSNAENESQVKAAAKDAIPELHTVDPTRPPLTRTQLTLDERINNTTWRVIARFEREDGATSGDIKEPEYSFDTGGGTQHITQSIKTLGKHGPEASDKLGGAIGYDGEHVAGVDITVPVYNFSETHHLANSTVTQAFQMNLYRLTGKINGSAFRGFQPGEVLFLGASGNRTGEWGDWSITYRFAASMTRSNFTVGSISVARKRGWDYMWVQYADDVDDEKSIVVKKPVAVYIEQVYEEGNFSQLGIGETEGRFFDTFYGGPRF